MLKYILTMLLPAMLLSIPAHAFTVYPGCAVPAAPAHVWYFDPVNGSTPDAAHGGLAVGGVMGTADGSKAHPFNSLQAVFTGGKMTPVAGYSWPLLSTAPYDHYPATGVHGQRRDDDWNPAAPNAARINPGDQIVLESGQYGDVGIGYFGVATANIDASGNTAFVSIDADAGATPVLGTLGISGARGFEVGGLTITSLLNQGAVNSSSLVHVGPGVGTQDIIIDGNTIEGYADWAAVNADFAAHGQDPAVLSNSTYIYRIAHGMTPAQAYYYITERKGVSVNGVSADTNVLNCVSVSGNTVRFVGTGFALSSASHVIITANALDHFGEDGFDFGNMPNSTLSDNVLTDPLNLADGNHPDSFQNEVQPGVAGPLPGDAIIGNRVYERTDPANPWPNSLTFFQNTGVPLTGMTISGNIAEISNCPGIALGSGTTNSLISGNTIVGNGAGNPTHTCPQSGESPGSADNTWVNNAVAGRFYQVCGNGSVWTNNVQIPVRSGGVSIPEALGYCNGTATTVAWLAGTYNGVTIIPTDSPVFAFEHYDPPATGLTSLSDPNLAPAVEGPLYQTGKPLVNPDIGAK